MDAGYCLYVHIFMKNIKSLKPFNFYNSNQLMPDSKLKYGLFGRVISCHDSWAQNCQDSCSKCTPCMDTSA